MSLFNVLDYWSTRCGENEAFGFGSITVADLLQTGNDLIIVGSFNGLLRIYQINANKAQQLEYKPSDLLLETRLPNNICQVVAGKLLR